MMETVSSLIRSVPVYSLAAESGIPVRTLYRWLKTNRIPGHDEVQAVQVKRIKAAVRKLKRADREAA